MDAAERSRFRRKLLNWFDRHQRELPWRRQDRRADPYQVWVSEIMLQQTQVATVIDYFNRFVKRFPDVVSLAAADESELLKYWEGLGYYRRGRQMHRAARLIVEEHQGCFPTTFDEVLALPGIGRYTAGAILSISRDQAHPILEGNTIRLFARLLGMDSDPRSRENQERLWEFSGQILPRKRIGDFNQALMELGALVCKPKSPLCAGCPLASHCSAFLTGRQDQIPVAAVRAWTISLVETVAVVRRRSKFLVKQCQPGERWAGLWDFPRFELAQKRMEPDKALTLTQLKLREELGLEVELEGLGAPLQHAVTRYRITLHRFQTVAVQGRLRAAQSTDWQWVTAKELAELPLNTTGRKVARQVLDAFKKGVLR